MHDKNKLGQQIEQALTNEPTRAVSPHLFARIKARVMVVAAIQKERRQLGLSISVGALLLVALFGVGACLVAFPEHIEQCYPDYPGLRGYGDYVSVNLPLGLPRLVGMALIVAGIPLGLMLAAALKATRPGPLADR